MKTLSYLVLNVIYVVKQCPSVVSITMQTSVLNKYLIQKVQRRRHKYFTGYHHLYHNWQTNSYLISIYMFSMIQVLSLALWFIISEAEYRSIQSVFVDDNN